MLPSFPGKGVPSRLKPALLCWLGTYPCCLSCLQDVYLRQTPPHDTILLQADSQLPSISAELKQPRNHKGNTDPSAAGPAPGDVGLCSSSQAARSTDCSSSQRQPIYD